MRRVREAPRPLRLLGLALLGLGVLAACDEENLFEAQTVSRPEVVAITAPTSVQTGQVLDLQVRAVAPSGLDSIVVAVRGAFIADQTATLAGERDVTQSFSFLVPGTVPSPNAFITATAYDTGGLVSQPASDTVQVQ